MPDKIQEFLLVFSSCLCTVSKNPSIGLCICFQQQITEHFITFTTHFILFKVWKPDLFSMSLHFCHTLLKLWIYKAYISGTIKDSLKISTDPGSLYSRLTLQKIWSTFNNERCALVKHSGNSFNVNIFVHIPFKNKTKKWNFIFSIIHKYSLPISTKFFQKRRLALMGFKKGK